MFIYCNTEEQAIEIFKVYRNVGAYALNPKQNGVKLSADFSIPYAHFNFLPDDDTINGIRDGSLKLKKVIKKAAKRVMQPDFKKKDFEATATCMGMAMLISALTSDRRNKKGPPVIVFILDEKDPVKSKIIRKFMDGLLKAFGLRGHKYEDVEDLFSVTNRDVKKVLPKKVYKRWMAQTEEIQNGNREKDAYELVKPKEIKGKKGKKRKKAARKQTEKYLAKIRRIQSWKYIREKVENFIDGKKNGCQLSTLGGDLKRLLMKFYSIEIRQFAMSSLDPSKMDRKQTEACAQALWDIYSAENLKGVAHKFGKALSKKDQAAVKACKSLYKILKATQTGKPKKAPKPIYGYNREKISKKERKKGKKGAPTTPKMNKKKFMKFFGKKDNRELLVLLYTHSAMILMGFNIGSKVYNDRIKEVCKNFQAGFGRDFLAASKTYAERKGLVETAA